MALRTAGHPNGWGTCAQTKRIYNMCMNKNKTTAEIKAVAKLVRRAAAEFSIPVSISPSRRGVEPQIVLGNARDTNDWCVMGLDEALAYLTA